MLRNLFHEFVSTRIINLFLTWLLDNNYFEEAELISLAMQSWYRKYSNHLRSQLHSKEMNANE